MREPKLAFKQDLHGSIKEADGCSQWFLSLRSVVSGLEKPLLAGCQKLEKVEELIAFEPAEC